MIHVSPRKVEHPRCAVCGDEDHLTTCSRCKVAVHFECCSEGRCPTLGCIPEPAEQKPNLRLLLEAHERRTRREAFMERFFQTQMDDADAVDLVFERVEWVVFVMVAVTTLAGAVFFALSK